MKTRLLLIAIACGMGIVGLVAQTPVDHPNLINITTLEQLDAIRYDLRGDGVPTFEGRNAYETAFSLTSGENNTCSGRCQGYELMNDLDFAGTKWGNPTGGGFLNTRVAGGWVPIGEGVNSFGTTFEGNRHTIFNLYINTSSIEYVGLFGKIASYGEIRNLGLEGGSVKGERRRYPDVGSLGGTNFGTITACYATVSVTGGSYSTVGGLLASNLGTISACYATGSVTAGTFSIAGGLVGENFVGTISACYATGSVEGRGGFAGGLVGYNGEGHIAPPRTGGRIFACYATGIVTAGLNGSAGGGLVGGNASASTISASYARSASVSSLSDTFLGGLLGQNFEGTVSHSYFDHSISNLPDTDLGAQTTSALQTPTTYEGIYESWQVADKEDNAYWSLCVAGQYPQLQVDFNGDGRPTVAEFGSQGGTCSASEDTTSGVFTNPPFGGGGNNPTAGGFLENSALADRFAALEASQDMLKREIAGLKASQDTLKRERVAQDTQTTEIVGLKASQDTLKREIAGLKASQDMLKRERVGLKASQDTLKREIAGLKASQDMLKRERVGLKASQDTLKRERVAQDTQTTEIVGLKASQDTLKREIAGLKASQDMLKRDCVGLKACQDTLKRERVAQDTQTTEIDVPQRVGNKVRVYPNPADRVIHFRGLPAGSSHSYALYNLGGRKVLAGSLDRETIDIGELSAGHYILVLQDDHLTEVLRELVVIEQGD